MSKSILKRKFIVHFFVPLLVAFLSIIGGCKGSLDDDCGSILPSSCEPLSGNVIVSIQREISASCAKSFSGDAVFIDRVENFSIQGQKLDNSLESIYRPGNSFYAVQTGKLWDSKLFDFRNSSQKEYYKNAELLFNPSSSSNFFEQNAEVLENHFFILAQLNLPDLWIELALNQNDLLLNGEITPETLASLLEEKAYLIQVDPGMPFDSSKCIVDSHCLEKLPRKKLILHQVQVVKQANLKYQIKLMFLSAENTQPYFFILFNFVADLKAQTGQINYFPHQYTRKIIETKYEFFTSDRKTTPCPTSFLEVRLEADPNDVHILHQTCVSSEATLQEGQQLTEQAAENYLLQNFFENFSNPSRAKLNEACQPTQNTFVNRVKPL